MTTDERAATAAIEAFLRALGRDPATEPELRGTGARVAEAFARDLCAGYAVDVAQVLANNVLEGTTSLVVLRDVDVTTTCPHHLTVAMGKATVAFAPDRRLVGIGTLAAVVDAYARRLALQEAIGEQVVAALVAALAPRWAACRLVLRHGCLEARGDRRHGAAVETLAVGPAVDGPTLSFIHEVLRGGPS